MADHTICLHDVHRIFNELYCLPIIEMIGKFKSVECFFLNIDFLPLEKSKILFFSRAQIIKYYKTKSFYTSLHSFFVNKKIRSMMCGCFSRVRICRHTSKIKK